MKLCGFPRIQMINGTLCLKLGLTCVGLMETQVKMWTMEGKSMSPNLSHIRLHLKLAWPQEYVHNDGHSAIKIVRVWVTLSRRFLHCHVCCIHACFPTM